MSDSCVFVVEKFLEDREKIEPTLKGFTEINPVTLRAQALDLDNLHPNKRGPLHGLLIAVKEVYDVEGYVCGWGTPIHKNRKPEQDAAVVTQLKAAGALIAGITVSTEYAISRRGPTTNPHDNTRTPGASSQGSAAAVGAGLVPAALGSQTIGSVIRPAAYCGCIGFKPSWGLLDTVGSMPLAEPLDHPGLFSTNLELMKTLAEILQPKHNWRAELSQKPDVVLVEPWYKESTEQVVANALDKAMSKLSSLGVRVEKIQLPSEIIAHEERLVMTILTYGMAHNHGADFDKSSEQMSERVRDYISAGREVSDKEYEKAIREKEIITRKLDLLLKVRVFITAATTGVAPQISQGTGSRAPQRVWTLAGFPTLNFPFDSYRGLPIGVQIGASWGGDRLVLEVANKLL